MANDNNESLRDASRRRMARGPFYRGEGSGHAAERSKWLDSCAEMLGRSGDNRSIVYSVALIIRDAIADYDEYDDYSGDMPTDELDDALIEAMDNPSEENADDLETALRREAKKEREESEYRREFLKGM